MANEVSGNTGYLAIKAESAPGVVAGTPNLYVPMYDASIATTHNNKTDNVIFGSAFARLRVTPGVRSHGGDLTIMGEPNTAQALVKALLPQASTSGSGPVTTVYKPAASKPISYTADLSLSNQVVRYAGLALSSMEPDYADNEGRLKLSTAALKSFLGAKITSISTATVTLESTKTYPKPAELLYTGDLVAIQLANGTVENFTIASKTDTTVTLSDTPTGTVASGDMLVLRANPTPPVPTIADSFLWSRTEFRFGADAAAALTATHTPLESGSGFTISNPFTEDNGAQRSGSFDPASLPRSGAADATLKIKKFFDTADEFRRFVSQEKVAVVVRMFSGSGYEFRLTLNSLKANSNPVPAIATDDILYYEQDYVPEYDSTDGQGFSVTVISA